MSQNQAEFRGRLAPSPTGALHLGNIRTFLVAWLAVRSRGGKVILRIEDLEKPATGLVLEELLSDLAWLGLNWDEGPPWTVEDEAALNDYRRYPKSRLEAQNRVDNLALPAGSAAWSSALGRLIEPMGDNAPYIQSQRGDLYEAIFERLRSQGQIYPCVCTRSDYAANAPHAGDLEPIYPGTCRDRFDTWQEATNWLHQENIEAIAQGRETPRLSEPVWRFRVPIDPVGFQDEVAGKQTIKVCETIGDFVVFKSPRQPSYQMAVTIDDSAMDIHQVVRGNDLIASTARQILLYQAMNRPLPLWAHLPLVVGPDGKRIAKRHGDSRIRHFRDKGVDPQHIIGVLAAWTGIGDGQPCTPETCIPDFNFERIKRQDLVLSPDRLAEILDSHN